MYSTLQFTLLRRVCMTHLSCVRYILHNIIPIIPKKFMSHVRRLYHWQCGHGYRTMYLAVRNHSVTDILKCMLCCLGVGWVHTHECFSLCWCSITGCLNFKGFHKRLFGERFTERNRQQYYILVISNLIHIFNIT